MRFEQMSWSDVEQYLSRDNRLIVITGATEQHSSMSIVTDILIPNALADAVAEREQVLIAPPLSYGCSPYFATYPGTISLKLETFVIVVKELTAQFIVNPFTADVVGNYSGLVQPGPLQPP